MSETSRKETEETGAAGVGLSRGGRLGAGVVGLVALAAGVDLLVGQSRLEVSGGALLVSLSLGFLAAGLAGGPYGSRREGRLDLSARLALGPLGGFLGGTGQAVAVAALSVLGVDAALGMDLPGAGGVFGWLGWATAGAVWGLAFGLLYPRLPGRGSLARGTIFGAVPAAYSLLGAVAPGLDLGPLGLLDVGWHGVEPGVLTLAAALLLYLGWGGTAGSVLGWGESTEEAPVSRVFAESG